MICLDSSILIDYLDEETEVEDYLADKAEDGFTFVTTSVCMYEVFNGDTMGDHPTEESIKETLDQLPWLNYVDLGIEHILEGSKIAAELRDVGMWDRTKDNDIMIAGYARYEDYILASKDSHFNDIPGLEFDHI